MTEELRGESLEASLTVLNLDRSVAWYRDALGFSVDKSHERDGKVVAVSLRAGSVRLLLSADDGAKGGDRTKGEGISLQISTSQSVDDVAARIKGTGSSLDTEPVSMPWGVRILRVRDPDGFKLTISSKHAG